MDLRDGLLFFIVIVSSLCLREAARAWIADKLGDHTPYSEGRLTLNPAAHIDLVGTILFPLFCIFVLKGQFFMGWARPLTVNDRNFKHPGRADVMVTATGPLAHFALTIVSAVVGAVVFRILPATGELVDRVISINAWLFVFNMIPVPPLDGGRILRYLVNMSWETYARISQWSMYALLGAFYLVPQLRFVFALLIGITAAPAAILYQLLGGR